MDVTRSHESERAEFVFAIAFLSSLLMLGGCSTLNGADEVHRAENLRISLEPSGSAGNSLAHPSAIDVGQMSRILEELSFEERGSLMRSDKQPVFTGAEVRELSTGLVAGLRKARPDQRVSFVALGQGDSIVGNARKTEGTVFVDRQGRLNIAFAGIQHLMTVEDDFTRYREASLGDPLSTHSSLVKLVATQGFISPRTRDNGEVWPMWVTAPVPAGTSSSAPVSDERAAPVRAIPSTSPPTPATADRGSSEFQPDEIRQRLQFLKTLHEDGLITDEDYDQERQRILRRID